MKWDCGPTYIERGLAKAEWHHWFAWHPVRVGARDCRWLEFVERKGTFYFGRRSGGRWVYTYRALGVLDAKA